MTCQLISTGDIIIQVVYCGGLHVHELPRIAEISKILKNLKIVDYSLCLHKSDCPVIRLEVLNVGRKVANIYNNPELHKERYNPNLLGYLILIGVILWESWESSP